MRKSNLRATAAWQALAIFGAGAFIASPAVAQDASNETQPAAEAQPVVAGTEAQADADDAIVITGSRIVRPDLEAPSPVTTVSAEQFDLTGTVTVETLLNDLPQIVPGNTRVSNNQGGEAFSTLDLRGLGPQRTLILVDGERVPASSTSGVVDIGTIPAGLIERVDVVTGGASAVYGSDAMAGVINFVLKDNYEGLEVTSQYGISDHGDGGEFNIQGLLGGNFGDDSGNLTFFTSYYTRDAVGQGDRDFTRNASVVYYDYDLQTVVVPNYLEAPNANGANRGLYDLSASGTNPYGTISSSGNPFGATTPLSTLLPGTFANADNDCNSATPGVNFNTQTTISFNDLGQVAPSRTFSTSNLNSLCAFADRSTGSSNFNFNPLNYLVTPYKRWTMAMTGRYDISDKIRLKVLANYVDSSQTVNLAPTPVTGLVIDPTLNPFIRLGVAGSAPCGIGVSCHPDLLAALNSRANPNGTFTMSRRTTETGPRVGIYDSKTGTIRGTLSGPLGHGFNWDVTASYGVTDALSEGRGNINRTAINQGLAGCPAQSLPGCVPIDIFGADQLNAAYPSLNIAAGDMTRFVQTDTKDKARFDQVRVAGNITGNLLELPAGPVGIAIGAEARTDRGSIKVDDNFARGNVYGFNAIQDQKGKVNVKEIYGEVRIPVLADMPFFHELSLEAGARYSDYSTVGGLFNWKLGAQWAPTDWLKFRGIFNKAARAPSVVELFQGGDQGFVTVKDPCSSSPTPSAATLAICQAQAPAADFTNFAQPSPQLQVFAFGNPALAEESAKTWTVGAVLTPNLGIGRFSATIDYYNIKITDVISGFGASYFLGQCYQNGNTDPNSAECQRVDRDPLSGQINSIDTTVLNSGYYKATGVDASLNFVVPFSDIGIGIPGRLRFQELLSYADKVDFDGTEVAGYVFSGIGGTYPRWKSTLTAAYDSDSFTAQLRWNYIGKMKEYDAFLMQFEDDGVTLSERPALSYFDLSLRKKIGDNFELTGIVRNLFNAKPVKTPGGIGDQGGIDTTYYNPLLLGRYFTIQARVKM